MARSEDDIKYGRGKSRESDSSQLIKEYSKSLGKSAEALKDAAKVYDSTTQFGLENFHKDTSLLVSSFSEMVKSFSGLSSEMDDKLRERNDEFNRKFEEYLEDHGSIFSDVTGSIEDAADKNDSSRKKAATAFDKALSRQNKEGLARIDKARAVGNAIITTFSTVFNYGIDKITNGFYSVVDSYNSHLTSVTSKMQWTNEDYTNALIGVSNRIENDRLITQFSQVDYLESFEDVLSSGLRDLKDDTVASDAAYQNMITKKLIPSISTNTRAYTRMSKLFGDTFTQGITAITKFAEENYGAEGIEEGGIDTVINTLYGEIMSSVANSGGDKDDVVKVLQSVVAEYNEIAAKYGRDEADRALTQFKDLLTGSALGNSPLVIAAGSDAGLTPGSTEGLNDNSFSNFYDSLVSAYENLDLSGVAGIASTLSGIVDYDQVMAIRSGSYFNGQDVPSSEDFISSFNLEGSTEGVMKDYMDRLANGDFQSKTAQQTKWNENLMAETASMLAEKVPDIQGVIDSIETILKVWFAAWAVRTVANKFTGDVGDLHRISDDIKGAAELFREGAKFSEVAGEGGVGFGKAVLGKASTVATPVLGAVAGVASIGMTIYDAHKGYKSAKEDGASTEEALGEGARTAITGHVGMTSEEKKSAFEDALSGEKQKFDFGELGGNASKGALGGAAIGSLAGGHPVIGAVVGGVVGAATNAFDQIKENWKYNKLADAVNDTAEAFGKLSESQSKYNETVNKGKRAQELLNVIGNKSVNSTKERESALDELVSMYPTALGNVKDLSDWDEQYVNIVKSKVEYEKQASQTEMVSGALEASNTASEGLDTAVDNGFFDFATDKERAFVGSLSYDSTQEDILKAYESAYGVSRNDEGFWEGFSSTVRRINNISEGGDVFRLFKDIHGNDKVTIVDDLYGYSTRVDSWNKQHTEENDQEASSQAIQIINEYKSAIDELYNTLSLMALDSEGNVVDEESLSASTKTNIETVAKEMKSDAEYLNEIAGSYNLSAYHVDLNSYPNIKEIFDLVGLDATTNGSSSGSFKVGTEYVPYDDYSSVLHKGEMVLTSSYAEKLRQLSKTGVRGFIDDLSYLDSMTVSPEVSSDDSSVDFGTYNSLEGASIALPDISGVDINVKTISSDNKDSMLLKEDNDIVPKDSLKYEDSEDSLILNISEFIKRLDSDGFYGKSQNIVEDSDSIDVTASNKVRDLTDILISKVNGDDSTTTSTVSQDDVSGINFDSVVSAIDAQTKELSGVLNSILSLLTSTLGKNNPEVVPYTSADLVSYKAY